MILLDTNVVSELRKAAAGRCAPAVAAWAAAQPPDLLFLSAIGVLELERGILLAARRDAAEGTVLRRWMDERVLPAFAGRILPVDAAVAIRAARLHGPDPSPDRDALIAATALVHGMALATRNTADFARTGVRLIDPWLTDPRPAP